MYYSFHVIISTMATPNAGLLELTNHAIARFGVRDETLILLITVYLVYNIIKISVQPFHGVFFPNQIAAYPHTVVHRLPPVIICCPIS